MAGEYYAHTTFPSNGASGSSADMRAELEEIEAGFDKLPTLAGNGTKLVVVNAGATALEASNTITSPTINGTVATTGLTMPAFTSGAINGTTIPASKTLVVTTDTIGIAAGGTGQTAKTAAFDALAPTTTKGDVIVYNGSDNIRLAAGTDGYYLKSNSGTASGLEWTAIPTAEVTLTNSVTLSNKSYTSTGIVTFASEVSLGTQTAVNTTSVVWSGGQKQYIVLDGTSAFATTLNFDFTDCGVGHYQLRVRVADSFSYTIVWGTNAPGSSSWLGSTAAPALYTGGANRDTIFSFYWNGTTCYGSGSKVGSF